MVLGCVIPPLAAGEFTKLGTMFLPFSVCIRGRSEAKLSDSNFQRPHHQSAYCDDPYSSLQGMVVNGFVNVVISTLERRFGLTSAQTGLIAGSYDIGSLLSVIPITYFGGRLGSSKPR